MKAYISLLSIVSLGVLFPALQPARADTRDDVWAAMQRCQSIPDDRTWLDCTYGAKQPMRAKLGLPPASDYQQRLVPPAPRVLPPATARALPPRPDRLESTALPRKSFMPGLSGNAGPNTISALAQVQYDSRGAFVVTLENGQVWRQVNVEIGRKIALRAGARVTITPGVMWTYDLKTDGDTRSYKVQRQS